MSTRNQIWQSIELQMRKSKKKHPNWPDHIAAQAGIISQDSGKLMELCLEMKYHNDKSAGFQEMKREQITLRAIKTAVNAIRFLENLK